MPNELITAFVLGLIGGAIPGPVLTALFTEILQSGFLKSFRIMFNAMFTETFVAFVSLFALASLHLPEAVFRGMSFVGAAILIWIATSMWSIKKIDTENRVHFGFWKISALILANGMLWTYWITVCVPKAIFLGEHLAFGEYVFLGLIEIGWLIATALIAFIFSRFRSFLSKPKAIPFIFKAFAVAFVYFALDMTYNSVIFFITQSF